MECFKEVENARSGADLIFWHLLELREEAGCCRLGAFGAISFGGNSFGGGGAQGGAASQHPKHPC